MNKMVAVYKLSLPTLSEWKSTWP